MIWVELDGGVCYELGDDSFLLQHLLQSLQRHWKRSSGLLSGHSRRQMFALLFLVSELSIFRPLKPSETGLATRFGG